MKSLTNLSLTLRFLKRQVGASGSQRSRSNPGWWAIGGALALGLNLVWIPASVAQALQRGDQGTAVTTLQTQLQDLGYYDGTVDGVYGTGTEIAVTRFQQSAGLTVDGIAGDATQAALQNAIAENQEQATENASPELATEQVEQIQSQLQRLGYYEGAIDGILGAETQAAIERFQGDRNLSVDGIAGPETLTALQAAINNETSSETNATVASFNAAGLSADETAELQTRLQALGYYPGTIDGVYGADTVVALQRFQQSNGLTADGVAGFQTWEVLRRLSSDNPPAAAINPAIINFGTQPPATPPLSDVPYPPIRRAPAASYSSPVSAAYLAGVASPDVQNLQLQLKVLGFYKGDIDGVYGDRTREAVVDFQRSQGLYPDGIAGQGTLAALKNWSEAVGAGNFPIGGIYTGPFSILELQKRLKARGFYTGPLDGQMGEQTRTAIDAAQRYYGLPPIDIYSGRF